MFLLLILKIFLIIMIIGIIVWAIIDLGPIAWVIVLFILFSIREHNKDTGLMGKLINFVVWIAIILVVVGIYLTIFGGKI